MNKSDHSRYFEKRVFQLNEADFEQAALRLFQFQFQSNPVYNQYCSSINCKAEKVKNIEQIPFLPISLFKTYPVKSTDFNAEITFLSSGTTQSVPSQHHIKNLTIYKTAFQKCFDQFYGDITNYKVLALLPSYLERKGSSLIYMVNDLIKNSKQIESGFFLSNFSDLTQLLNQLSIKNEKTLLIGVSFGLLDYLDNFTPNKNENLVVMETGGMKGRREEIIREELHEILKSGFKVNAIHSEYGMTELLSQAYAQADGKFKTPNWMKVLIRKYDDPFSYCKAEESGGINIIDLANIYSCSFIQTDDIGKINQDGHFEVLGRFDHSEVRGCNLMAL